jgi:6-pyruvoyltetrahydropterin/6-carboxytetrahydropterin synthase
MVVDLGLVRLEIEQLRAQLDHHLLDEVPGLGPATLENLCRFIFDNMAKRLPQLSSVRVWRDALGDGCTLSKPLAP